MSDLKMQPSSKEAEEAMLGCIISGGNDTYERARAWIKEDNSIYYKDNKLVWKAMTSLYQDRKDIEMITVIEKCKDMGHSLAYLVSGLPDEVVSIYKVGEYARIVWERYMQREAAKSARKLYDTSFRKYDEVKVLIDSHIRTLEELKNAQPDKDKNIAQIVDETVVFVKTGNNLIPFNNVHLDAPAGGMTRKEVTVLGGRPGHGKTTLMINIVKGLIESGKQVMLFNREMSNTEMMKKIIVMESKGLSYQDIRRGDVNEKDIELFNQTSENIKSKYSKLTMYDDIRTLEESINEVSKYKPDVIIDDYIQLISMPQMERRLQLERIMQDYKWVCKKEDCSAILISQLNRAIEYREDPKPRMSDYAESGVIEQTAETALFVWYGYNFDDSQYSPYQSEIISAKTRYGRIGSYVLGFNGDKCRFYDSQEEAMAETPVTEEDDTKSWGQTQL